MIKAYCYGVFADTTHLSQKLSQQKDTLTCLSVRTFTAPEAFAA